MKYKSISLEIIFKKNFVAFVYFQIANQEGRYTVEEAIHSIQEIRILQESKDLFANDFW